MSTSHPPNAAVAAVLALRKQDPQKYGTQALLAKATGLDQKSWSNYINGVIPSKLARDAIQRKLKINSKLWNQPADGASDHRNNPTVDDASVQAPREADSQRSEVDETPTDVARVA